MITILMSSYNGEKYIKDQIESLCCQIDCCVRIIVRDDGSKDSTCDILDSYKNNNVLDWYCGSNLRPARSFWNLIQKAPNSEYYALCDQDDYWQPDKLSAAVAMLKDYDNIPSLYFSQTTLVDSNLSPLKTPLINPKCTMGEALIAHYATGCTFVFNKELMKILRMYNPEYLSMHDNWIYRVCLAVGGKVIFDPTSHILYRQHGNNVIGLTRTKKQIIKRKISTFFNSSHERNKIAKELVKGYGALMDKDTYDMISNAAMCDKSVVSRIKFIVNPKVSCSSFKCNISSRMAILLGLY